MIYTAETENKNAWNSFPQIRLIRKAGNTVPEEAGEKTPILQFPNLEATGVIRQAFSTRLGGVSGPATAEFLEMPHLASMNLSFSRGDDPEHVRENFRRIAEELGAEPERFVFTDQTHTAVVRVVTEEDAGKGLTRPRDYTDTDGLVTNVPGIVLSVFTADCVPVAMVDPVHKAIGLVHSGWKGTVGKISAEAIRLMNEKYGTDPKDLVCAVAPSICQDCYEVSEDVAEHFRNAYPGRETEIMIDKHNGHYQLDLWAANRICLEEAGVPESQIAVTGICTACNADYMFSHRASHGMRGNMGAFLMLKE
ncbi:MAG: peptidoglycan editing factor PgeF [Eubacteriales bacterium]|nr:peptidoglycan editing factor PgeF [Eubacteriales bacterium]